MQHMYGNIPYIFTDGPIQLFISSTLELHDWTNI